MSYHKLLLFIFSFLSLINGVSQKENLVKEQLFALNQYWSVHDLNYSELNKTKNFQSDRELIQLHLSLVIRSLRKADHELSAKQLQNREKCLNILEKYCLNGVFPKNEFHDSRTPYFIDRYGTACAVGQMIIESGYENLAQKISIENNYAYIKDLNYPELTDWANKHGFTLEELKWIQPAYSFCNSPCDPYTKKDVSCYGGNDGCIGQVTADTVAAPFTFAWYHLNNGVWDLFSYDPEICDLFAGKYKCVFTGANGGTETHLFTISQPDSIPSDTSITTCGSYLAPDSVTYYNSGQLPMLACDSLPYNINLTILSSTDTAWSATSCKSFTAPDGSVYTTSGIYYSVLTNSVGCDSTIEINLAIINDGLAIQQQSDTLIANIQGASYQWWSCDSSFSPIPGEQSASFVPATNGSYAVTVTQNNCTDTSTCFNVNFLNTNGLTDKRSFSLFPNPNSGVFKINLGDEHGVYSISIIDISGKEVYKQDLSGSLVTIKSSLEKGLYYVKIKAAERTCETIPFIVK